MWSRPALLKLQYPHITLGILLRFGFPLSRSEMTRILHFQSVLGTRWCCPPMDHISSSKGLEQCFPIQFLQRWKCSPRIQYNRLYSVGY